MQKRLLLMCLGVLLVATTWADTMTEREALQRILNELSALHPLILEAKSQQQTPQRIQFRYDWLTQDIEQIIHGIEAGLTSVPLQAKQVKPIIGDYLTSPLIHSEDRR